MKTTKNARAKKTWTKNALLTNGLLTQQTIGIQALRWVRQGITIQLFLIILYYN